MAKPSRWTAAKRYQIVKEALSQKEPDGFESQFAGFNRHKSAAEVITPARINAVLSLFGKNRALRLKISRRFSV